MSDFAPFIPWIGLVLGALCIFGSLRSGKRKRLVDDTPTSKTTGVFIGLVELKGTAETGQPLMSFLAERKCAHYSWSVEEHWRRTVTETYTDKDGRTRTRTRVETGWTTVANGGETIPFYLKDDLGAILVRPDGAEIEAQQIFARTCGAGDPLYYAKGPPGAIMNSTFTRRFTETAIPLHAPLYVMGQSRERKDVVAPEIAHDKAAPMFLISVCTEEQVSRGFAWAYWLWGFFGMALAIAGFVIRDAESGFDPGARLLGYVLIGSGFILAWMLGWAWMVFNSLVGLRQRVRQAWATLDVQLKRRHDLIPNLVETVKGLRDHESNLQTELAELRSQAAATPPGAAGPDFHGLAKVTIGIAERYPELRAQESFLELQRELVNTEQRIALARGYFNEIATFYNMRLEIIPDRFIAPIARLQPQTLLAATDFERAPVEVQFAE
ncbi:MAG: LemA domain-containing protein [Verrucomicrobia bacterium]|nr:LemA domain-containing protein [Verrucomicrobiota bacterium]